MDSESGGPAEHEVSRRGLLGALAAGGVAAGIGLAGPAPAEAAVYPASKLPRSGTGIVLLGTQAGPPPDPARAGISTALVVDGKVYLVDCGRSSVTQYQRAGLRFADLQSIFLTHLHADHIADYYNFFVLAGSSSSGGDAVLPPIGVHGPGSAGALPPAAGGAEVPTLRPEAPVPGTKAMTEAMHAAFAYANNISLRASPRTARDIETVPDVHEIDLPDVGATALGPTAPPMEPFSVMEDDRVRVTATLVPHGTVFPSFAFRFDTDHGSVTFSGDTARSANLVRLAKGSDILVHEAIKLTDDVNPQFRASMLASHVLVEEVGEVAQEAQAGHLVLSHIGDFSGPVKPSEWRKLARRGYDGRVTVGEDLMSLAVG
ncbi:MBL fold metallo-hydrolase [Microbacterium sp. NPDC057659]|uniref:MBL fold metallo-hydrolase n=1 Tax=Microbacterium sp. NPDC057659 TaxID=3346198 RepID=UPI0036700D35